MEFKKGDYVVLKSNYTNDYSTKLVEEYGIKPQETIGLINDAGLSIFESGKILPSKILPSVIWRLPTDKHIDSPVHIDDIEMAFKKGRYVVLKSNYTNPYSILKLVKEYGIKPQETIGLINDADLFIFEGGKFLPSVIWRLHTGQLKDLLGHIDDIEVTTPPTEAIIPPGLLHGGKKARKVRKSRKVRKFRKVRKSRKARKSRRRARR
jgi:hypothetical protein